MIKKTLKEQRNQAQNSFPVNQSRTILLAWYQQNKRDLPWRQSQDPWAIWVSEIMLQQTRVSSVLDYFDRFMKNFPTIDTFSKASWEEVSQAWAGLGYYRRAKHLHAAAQQVCQDYQGVIPNDPKSFRALKGVGAYTAGAVMSIAFNLQEPIVDGNVARVFSRLYAWTDQIDSTSSQKHLWDWAQQWVIGERPGDLNQALMELGATVCTVKNPQCEQCPLQSHCIGQQQQVVSQLPHKKSRKKELPIEHYYALVSRETSNMQTNHQAKEEESLWLIRRSDDGLLGGLWGLPTMICEQNEETLKAWISSQNDLFANAHESTRQNIKNIIEKTRGVHLSDYPQAMIEHKFTHKIWRFYLWYADGKPTCDSQKEDIAQLHTVAQLSQIALDGPSLKGLLALGYPLKKRRGAGKH